jgi:hypothetical protein
MTKLAEDLRFVFEHGLSLQELTKQFRADEIQVSRLEHQFPGLIEFHSRIHDEIRAILRKAKVQFAGLGPWETSEQAVNATGSAVLPQLRAFLEKSMARGMTVGNNIERFQNLALHKWSKDVYSEEGWQEEVAMNALQLSVDDECGNILRETFTHAFGSMNSFQTFKFAKGRATLRVWDLWDASMGTTAIFLYVVGLQLGQKHAEEAALEKLLEEANEAPPA